jgi:hypothetical protein
LASLQIIADAGQIGPVKPRRRPTTRRSHRALCLLGPQLNGGRERLARNGDLPLEVILVDDSACPDAPDQRVFAHHFPCASTSTVSMSKAAPSLIG